MIRNISLPISCALQGASAQGDAKVLQRLLKVKEHVTITDIVYCKLMVNTYSGEFKFRPSVVRSLKNKSSKNVK